MLCCGLVADQLEACCRQLVFDFFDLGGITCFQLQFEEAAGDGHVGITAVVVYADNVGTALTDNLADLEQLARTVLQHDNKVDSAATGNLTAGNNTRKNINVDVTAGYNADGFLALNRQLIEQRCCYRSCACTFGNQLLLFNQG